MHEERLANCILCAGGDLDQVDAAFNACRCRGCGLVFENPRPTLESIVAFYSKPVQYDEWLRHLEPRDRLWRRRLAKMRRHLKPGSLLDIGAGIGQFLSVAKPRFTQVTGTEISESAVKIAKEKFGLDLIKGEAETCDFGGRRFDNITIFHVFEHVPSPQRLIAKCADLLAPGGVLFIAVPNDIKSLGAVKRRWQGGRSRSRYGLPKLVLDGSMDEIHLSHFTAEVLARRLSAAGFEVLDCSLDPAYVASGARLLVMNAVYAILSAVRRLAGVNLYGTIWIAARSQRKADR